jgi:uncharacterized protein
VTVSPESYVLPERVSPAPEGDLDAAYWKAVRDERLLVLRCDSCHEWLWGPEWICPACHSFQMSWTEVPRVDGQYVGVIYSWERIWHPTDARLGQTVPFVVYMVSIPSAGNIRMLGNLVGDQTAEVEIGASVRAVFEHHEQFTLVQWAPL